METTTSSRQDGGASVTPDLTLAIRRARVENAQHAEALAELRGGEIARLEMLAEALKPVLSQVPTGVDLFDAGLSTGERPRFFIDMLAFVEMARDRRTYRFLQDTRHGRVTVLESDEMNAIVEAATAYIARRLVERERALASDQTIELAARALIAHETAATAPDEPAPLAPTRHGVWMTAMLFTIELLGSIVLCMALAAVGYLLWSRGAPEWLNSWRS
jgi:hypothetical protein